MGEESFRLGRVAVVGLISDTHGLLRPQALKRLAGSDVIIHAGDVGNPEILGALREIAPVVAVRGNVDIGPWAAELPEAAIAETPGGRIYVLHDVKRLKVDPLRFRAVVSGHSHKPGTVERDGVLYINPGAAGPCRFRQPVTVARLDVTHEPWTVEFVDVA